MVLFSLVNKLETGCRFLWILYSVRRRNQARLNAVIWSDKNETRIYVLLLCYLFHNIFRHTKTYIFIQCRSGWDRLIGINMVCALWLTTQFAKVVCQKPKMKNCASEAQGERFYDTTKGVMCVFTVTWKMVTGTHNFTRLRMYVSE